MTAVFTGVKSLVDKNGTQPRTSNNVRPRLNNVNVLIYFIQVLGTDE